MKMLYDQSVFSDEFLIGWFETKIKSDKKCMLYDRKTEKAFRLLITDFITWLQSAEYGEEAEEADEAQEETKEEVAKESDAARNQRKLIEAQKAAQAEALNANRAQAEEDKELKGKGDESKEGT